MLERLGRVKPRVGGRARPDGASRTFRATDDGPGYLGLAADGGTLVFDELGDIGTDIQGKLLRPVENRVYRRVGDSETRGFLGRFVFSTNKDLRAMVRRGKFREDLYTRVNVLRIVMPPLRRILREALDERSHYVRGFAEQTVPDGPESWDGWADSIESGIARKKAGHDWRGNLPATGARRRAGADRGASLRRRAASWGRTRSRAVCRSTTGPGTSSRRRTRCAVATRTRRRGG